MLVPIRCQHWGSVVITGRKHVKYEENPEEESAWDHEEVTANSAFHLKTNSQIQLENMDVQVTNHIEITTKKEKKIEEYITPQGK